ncbi:divergent PAP2 family protein [Candidatus Omnitrophota bacterium]
MMPEDPLADFLRNPVIVTTFFGWLIAQLMKVGFGIIRKRRFNFRWLVGTGGMPSSHASGVTAMTTAVGLYHGVDTALFGVALMFAVVVICDAQGVRRAAGEQASILNKILDDIYWKKKIQEDRLKELLGHTPFQIIAGIAVGLLVALLFHYFILGKQMIG